MESTTDNKSRSELGKKKWLPSFLSRRGIDIFFLIFTGILAVQYWRYISEMQTAMWDGAAYLVNARNWLTSTPLYEPYRPPLISWIIAGIWSFTGENWIYVKPLVSLFTIGSGILLYLTLRGRKGGLFALGVTILTMLNTQVFFYSSQIYTEGLSLFFLIATLYFIKGTEPNRWLLGGVMIGLTFASRYPIILPCLVIFAVESLIRRNWNLVTRAVMGALPVLLITISAVYLKTGTFQVALSGDTHVSFFLSPFYLVNSINIWGPAFLLVPVIFLFGRTYRDNYNYSFIAWFLVSLLFWSSNPANLQYRFTVGFTPAVNYLVFLAVENLARIRQGKFSTMTRSEGERAGRNQGYQLVSKSNARSSPILYT